MFVGSVEGANQREEVGTQIRKGVADEARSLKWCWELDDGAEERALSFIGQGEGGIPFPMREGSFIKGQKLKRYYLIHFNFLVMWKQCALLKVRGEVMGGKSLEKILEILRGTRNKEEVFWEALTYYLRLEARV